MSWQRAAGRHAFALLLLAAGAIALASFLREKAKKPEARPRRGGGGAAPIGSAIVPIARVLDLSGGVHQVLSKQGARAAVLVFLGTECPVANRYVPELRAIARESAPRGVELYGVISDPTVTRAAALEHARQFSIDFPVVLDASGDLAERFAPTHTPEAFVLDVEGGLAYRGRIDDLYLELGKTRARPTRHDLRDAIAAVVEGRPVAEPRTTPVGCVFEAWKPTGSRPAPTYARDVAPILATHCVECHRPGEIGPFALTSFAEAAKRSRTIAEVVRARFMPPWRPVPGHGRFKDERRLSEREIATLERWAAASAPEGGARDLPPATAAPSGWRLGEPDLVVEMPRPFDVPADGPDIWRCFPIPLGLAEDRVVTALELRPGAPSVIHHVLYYLDDGGEGRKREAASGGVGYPSFGGPGIKTSGELGGWNPGRTSRLLPDGMGWPLAKGQDLVLQVHYHPSGRAEKDRTRIGFHFAKGPVRRHVGTLHVWNMAIDIPPGESRYRRWSTVTLPVDLSVVEIQPHMHLLGRAMKVSALLPSGEIVPLVWIQDYDFRRQDQYQYVSPIRLPRGTKVWLEAWYDNSGANPDNPNDPPRRVLFGERTTDEMCMCFVRVAVDRPEDLALVRAASLAARPAPPDQLLKKR